MSEIEKDHVANSVRPGIKYMNIKEFREEGYLSELNRRFLHPLGLAMSVKDEGDGTYSLGEIWDYRDDPEGIYFADDVPIKEKAENIYAKWVARHPDRWKALGYMIQPVKGVNKGVEISE